MIKINLFMCYGYLTIVRVTSNTVNYYIHIDLDLYILYFNFAVC